MARLFLAFATALAIAPAAAPAQQAMPSAPAQMAPPSLVGGMESVTLRLAPPPADGGAAITGYEYQLATASDPSNPVMYGQALPSQAEPVEIKPLRGAVYIAWTRAVNQVGAGPWSSMSGPVQVADGEPPLDERIRQQVSALGQAIAGRLYDTVEGGAGDRPILRAFVSVTLPDRVVDLGVDETGALFDEADTGWDEWSYVDPSPEITRAIVEAQAATGDSGLDEFSYSATMFVKLRQGAVAYNLDSTFNAFPIPPQALQVEIEPIVGSNAPCANPIQMRRLVPSKRCDQNDPLTMCTVTSRKSCICSGRFNACMQQDTYFPINTYLNTATIPK